MPIKVLFHSYGIDKHCPDGFAAAYCAWKKFGNDAEYLPVEYGGELPEINPEDEIYILDFSYKRDILKSHFLNVTKNVVILDHHKTAQEELLGIKGALFDLNRSGAQIAWDYWFSNQSRPLLIDYVGDRDLWNKELPHTEEMHLALCSLKQDFKVWDVLCNMTNSQYIDFMLQLGKPLYAERQTQITELVATTQIKQFENYQVGVINTNNYSLVSDACNDICKQYEVDFSANYKINDEGIYKWSLRSIGEFDVSTIAQQFGGGGHKNAAGCASNEMFLN